MPDVVGILFGKPDGVVRCYHYAHDAMTSTWWSQILKGLNVWIKDDQGVLTHCTEPDPSLVIDRWSHWLAPFA